MKIIFLLIIVAMLQCSLWIKETRRVTLNEKEKAAAGQLMLNLDDLSELQAKPLYQFSPEDLDIYLRFIHLYQPDLRERIQYLARKNISQPYKIYLLGEFPFEVYDMQPLFCLERSDCVVFSEHVYAMALARNWQEFMVILQHIRYKDGQIGMLTRNHYTELDWDHNNSWLVSDITVEIGGEYTRYDTVVIDKRPFFKRMEIGQHLQPDTLILSYIPAEHLTKVSNSLLPGDFINIVRGPEPDQAGDNYVGHVGLITRNDSGVLNMLHSTLPAVIEQPLNSIYYPYDQFNQKRHETNLTIMKSNQDVQYHNQKIKQKYGDTRPEKLKKTKPLLPFFYGFKFLRLNQDPLQELKKRSSSPDSLFIRFGIPLP